MLIEYATKLVGKLNQVKDAIANSIAEISEIVKQENQVDSTSYLEKIRRGFKFVKDFLEPKDQLELLRFDAGKIKKRIQSVIISKADVQSKLLEMIGPKAEAELLYRGTRDGFGLADCHSKIAGKGPTLAIVKTTKNRIFGGYTNIPWASSGVREKDKGLSFVFSLKNDELRKFKVK